MSLRRILRRLLRHKSGVAMVEFALGTPFLLTVGLWGVEEANYVLVNMQISQLAEQIADNASRIGETSSLQNRKIYEADINDLLLGAQIQSGSRNLYDNGRVVISSLEESTTGTKPQYIHWQRCRGAKPVNSSYGAEADTFTTGMGPTGYEVMAQTGQAVMFVEINYTYQPLVSAVFVGRPDITSIASFTVRDNRDLTQIYQRDTAHPDPIQRCNVHSGNMVVSAGGAIT